MKQVFELAAASTIGRDHRLIGRNNQDAWYHISTDRVTVIVVADGCGEGLYSEVGARLGSRLMVEALFEASEDGGASPELVLEIARQNVVKKIEQLVGFFVGPRGQIINEHFLFTLVGCVLTETMSWFFSIGDGYLAVNGTELPLGSFEGNMPPYLSYALVTTALAPSLLKGTIHRVLATTDLDSFVLGTDGLQDYVKRKSDPIPGKTELVGSLDQLAKVDRYFLNPDALRRRLSLISRDTFREGRPVPGLLGDDTTLVVGRRKKVRHD